MIPIYFDELTEVLHACVQLRPDDCSPGRLRQLMTNHLAHIRPDLAQKVSAFDEVQMVALCAFVLQAQALVGMTAAGQGPG